MKTDSISDSTGNICPGQGKHFIKRWQKGQANPHVLGGSTLDVQC